MGAALEDDHVRPPCRVPRKLEARFDGLGTAVREEEGPEPGEHEGHERLDEAEHRLVVACA